MDTTAAELYKMAADRGRVTAQYNLSGLHVNVSPTNCEWITKAAEQGLEMAMTLFVPQFKIVAAEHPKQPTAY